MKVRMKRKYIKAAALLVCISIVVIGGFLLLNHLEQRMESPHSSSAEVQESNPQGTAGDQAVSTTEDPYVLRQGIETILLMGLDKFEADDSQHGYLNNQQSDFMMLLVLDRKANTCDMLHINRDTMVEMNRLGVAGDEAGTVTAQITLAHTYGSGGSDSCINSMKAVSNLLGGIHIDHYITTTMDGISALNDLVGGVTVNIMDDFTVDDPTMIQGKDMCLNGEQALIYIRGRQELGLSNVRRMERQRQYIAALYDQLMKKCDADDGFLTSAMTKLSGYTTTDYTINQVSDLLETLQAMKFNPIHTIDGEAVKGEKFMEFYVDEDSLKQNIQDLFYVPNPNAQ